MYGNQQLYFSLSNQNNLLQVLDYEHHPNQIEKHLEYISFPEMEQKFENPQLYVERLNQNSL
jgi:hypothetical protein